MIVFKTEKWATKTTNSKVGIKKSVQKEEDLRDQEYVQLCWDFIKDLYINKLH